MMSSLRTNWRMAALIAPTPVIEGMQPATDHSLDAPGLFTAIGVASMVPTRQPRFLHGSHVSYTAATFPTRKQIIHIDPR